MNLNNIVFINNYPKLDLHGYEKDMARILINDFINDNIVMKNEIITIIHGRGLGILRKTTCETLSKNKKVVEYKGVIGNDGCIIVKLKI